MSKAFDSQDLIGRLVRVFGHDRVLTDFEDLYVYSRRGCFAARSGNLPIAVMRLESRREEKNLEKIAQENGVAIIRINGSASGSKELTLPHIILDSRERQKTGSLAEMLQFRKTAKEEGRRRLREAPSFHHRLVAGLKNSDGFWLQESVGSDDGFCITSAIANGSETFSSKGRLSLSRGLLKGELKATGKLVDSLYSCTACGQCYDQFALDGFEINSAIVRARHEVVSLGAGPKQCKSLWISISELGNPLGMPAEDRSLWFEELAEEFRFEGEGVLYWTGCSTAYRLPRVVESTAVVMIKTGLAFGLLGEDEGCCGLILYLLGLWDEARRNASTIVEKLGKLGAKRVVTSCAGCYYAFTRVYPALGMAAPFEVAHTSQMMESLILGGLLHPKGLRGSYAWHDPCDLGRHSKVYEPPRAVLRSIPGLRLIEPELNREHSLCCGAGGGLWMYDSGLAEKIAGSKIDGQFEGMNLDGVVTGCPNCILSLKYAAGSKVNIYDISEIVGRSF